MSVRREQHPDVSVTELAGDHDRVNPGLAGPAPEGMAKVVGDNMNPELPAQPPEPLAESAGCPGPPIGVGKNRTIALINCPSCEYLLRPCCKAHNAWASLSYDCRDRTFPIYLRGTQ